MAVYIVTEYYCNLSEDDWKIVDVTSNEQYALLTGYMHLVNYALRHYVLDFYNLRKDQHKRYIYLPYYKIEKWVDGHKKLLIYLGYDAKTYYHHIDKMLKDKAANDINIEHILTTWKQQLNDGNIPEEIAILTKYEQLDI